jgi:hypothetical protein
MMMPGLMVFTHAPRLPHRTASAINASAPAPDNVSELGNDAAEAYGSVRRWMGSAWRFRSRSTWSRSSGFFLYYPSRRQQPAALAALVEALRL